MGAKLLILAGPSGGHLYPAIAFARYYREKHPDTDCTFIVTPRISSFLKASLLVEPFRVFYLPDFPFPQSFLLQASGFLLKLTQAFFKTEQIFRQVQPDAVIAFGTFVSLPGVILGHCKKISTVLHEQNVHFGRANRVLIPFATKVAVSFPCSLEKLPRGKGIWVGNILRPEMVEEARKMVLGPPKSQIQAPKKTQILVVGGSQGASSLNLTIFQTFHRFTVEERKQIAVIHITGVSDFAQFEHAYDELGIANEVFPFIDEMPAFYAASDLVIARAGAGTIAELALFGLPGILIPYPHAGSHQLANARYVAERSAACIIEESQLSAEVLKREILSLMEHPERLREMGRRARELAKPDAGERMVEEVEKLIEGRRR